MKILKTSQVQIKLLKGFSTSQVILINLYLITKCTNAAHKHIFSFPNTVIPFQVDIQVSQITKSLGIFPGWSLLPLRRFAYTEKRVRSWRYLIILFLSTLTMTSKGIQRIRHCWFWAFFKGVNSHVESHSCSPSSSPMQHQGKGFQCHGTLGCLPVMGFFSSASFAGMLRASSISELIFTSPSGRICTAHLLPCLHIH